MADLVIGIAKGKPPVSKSKDEEMGGEPPPSSREGEHEDLDEFEAALDDAYDALERKDRSAFKDALGAAISAKCEEMYGDEEHEEHDGEHEEKKEY